MKKTKTNAEMCEIATLRCENRKLTDRNKELEKLLRRARNELETIGAQYDDKQSEGLIGRIDEVLG